MNSPHWSQTDRARAQENLEESPSAPFVDCKDGLVAVCPQGWPALGMRFHGAFMLAPLPVLMAAVLLLLVRFLSEGWVWNAITLGVTLFLLVLLFGLARAFQMLTRTRELFPIKYFVTLGTEGAAMHFSRFHFPFRDPKTWLAWKEVESVQRTTGFFLPAWLTGRFRIPLLEIRSATGQSIAIPILQRHGQEQNMQSIEKLIREKTNQAKPS